MKNYLILFAFLFMGLSNSFAQNRVPKEQLSTEWFLIESKDGLNIYSKLINCDVYQNGKLVSYASFKFENTTSSNLTVQCAVTAYYTEGCIGCNGNNEATKSFTLNAGEAFESSCDAKNDYNRLILNPMLKGTPWTFEAVGITNLIINKN